MRSRTTFRSVISIALLLGLSANFTRAASTPTVTADPAYAYPQQLVEIEPQRHLNLYCIGTGAPSVIFESGLGNGIDVWRRVQPEIAKQTRACAYDRAGLGFSDAARRAGTSANIVDDLHRLLRRASIRPPYILVGHSYGGMNVVLYADLYPREVAGMVLVDPALESQVLHIRRYFPTYDESFVQPTLQNQRNCVAAATVDNVSGTKPSDEDNCPAISPTNQRAILSETESSMTGQSGEQLRAARRSFHNMPLIILAIPLGPQSLVPDETQAMQDAIHAARGRELEALARRSSKGVVRFVPDTGHYIQMDQPSVVVDSIRELLNQVP